MSESTHRGDGSDEPFDDKPDERIDATSGESPAEAEKEDRPSVTPGLLGHTDPDGTTPETIENLSISTATVIEDWRAYGYTPPSGIPIGPLRRGAPGAAPWPDRMRTLLRTPMSERPAYERTYRSSPAAEERAALPAAGTPANGIPVLGPAAGASSGAGSTAIGPAPTDSAPHPPAGPSAPRILDLTLRIAELLLASGESAEDVEAAMLGVTHAYGLDRCEPTVTFTLLSISYQPSLVEPPISVDRVVRRRGTDYTRLAAVYLLVADITSEQTTVEEAYRRLAEIRRNRHPFPGWAITLCGGGLTGAATLLVGGRLDGYGLLIFASAFLAHIVGDRLAWILASRGLPEFYQFVIAAMPAAAVGIALVLAGMSTNRASVAITGGLFALFPGRALVAAVADGLTAFYITAAARMLEVMYLVVGIVVGVLLMLYGGVSIGARLHPEQALLKHNDPWLQLVAAALLTLCFAVMLQTERHQLALVTINGAVGWTVFGTLTVQAGFSPILATGIAAGLVGLFGQLASRYEYASALPYVTAAIGPLLPGSAIYLGILGLAQGDPQDGLLHLSTAIATALALAVGVNLGGEIARLFMRVPYGEPGSLLRRGAKRTRGF
ncbi:threonine/serine exporter family protein [Phaeacidiphilus oryzae]|uniref:threonine/serine ThrE exporter family protein n=1 Tax=Phaeacidiphilus oryzae TaxID=348818 RepID=UPI00068C6F17|nr:threonine/serine exporter family protein [Phaeacidiphilus oryzae]